MAQQRERPLGRELDALARAIYGRFVRLPTSPDSEERRGLVEHLVRYIHRHLEELLRVSDLARYVNCSEGHLHRAFQAATGLSPARYVEQARVRHALYLLAQEILPVAEVAARVGYADPLHFSRVVRRLTGVSPKAIRNSRSD